jgi:hypothetical protein
MLYFQCYVKIKSSNQEDPRLKELPEERSKGSELSEMNDNLKNDIQDRIDQQATASDMMQDLVSLTTLMPGTVLNLLVIVYIQLSPHKRVITNILLTLYSLFNTLICLQTTPLAAAVFTSHSLVTEKHCSILVPLYTITSNFSTYFLTVLAVDLGLSLVYKTEQLLTKCKFVVMTVIYLCLQVVVELMR